MASALMAAVVIGSAACGDSKASDARPPEADDVTTTTTTVSSVASGKKDAAKPASTPTTVSSTTTPSAGVPANADPKTALVKPGPKGQLEVKATLAEACVRPGGGQSITILTRPGSGAGYDTVYSDGKSGMMEGHYGGNFGGTVGDDGTWSDTWVVAPNAPPGKVQVNVIASNLDYGHAQTTLYFTVADPTGNCA
jgi:hypothetical protein